MRYLLTFYADEAESMALPAAERDAAIGRIGEWFGMHASAGKIVDGKKLAGGKRATTTVRLSRIQVSGMLRRLRRGADEPGCRTRSTGRPGHSRGDAAVRPPA